MYRSRNVVTVYVEVDGNDCYINLRAFSSLTQASNKTKLQNTYKKLRDHLKIFFLSLKWPILFHL